MALSGSVNFALTRSDLITMALQDIGALEEGGTASSTQLTESALLLNSGIKSFIPDGLQLWMRLYGYILPVSSTSKTALGAEGGHATASYDYTTTSAAASSGATTITVSSITGIAASDNIGVELDDGTMQWTTVSGAPSGSTVTLATALTDDVASGADVYTYTTKLTRPSKVIEAFRRHSSDDTDTPMIMLTNSEYNNLSQKTTTGAPVQWHYDEILGFSTSGYPGNGDFYYWPRFQNGDDIIVIKYIKTFDDLDAATDNPEFPQEWFLPIMKFLAWLLAPKHGVQLKERQLLLSEALMLKQLALEFSQEYGSLYIRPNGRK